MTNEDKAKLIADQCKPCSDDFYSGIKQGVLLALNAEKQKLEEIEIALKKVISEHNWAKSADPEGGSMWEAYDIGVCHGQTKLSEEILNLLN